MINSLAVFGFLVRSLIPWDYLRISSQFNFCVCRIINVNLPNHWIDFFNIYTILSLSWVSILYFFIFTSNCQHSLRFGPGFSSTLTITRNTSLSCICFKHHNRGPRDSLSTPASSSSAFMSGPTNHRGQGKTLRVNKRALNHRPENNHQQCRVSPNTSVLPKSSQTPLSVDADILAICICSRKIKTQFITLFSPVCSSHHKKPRTSQLSFSPRI